MGNCSGNTSWGQILERESPGISVYTYIHELKPRTLSSTDTVLSSVIYESNVQLLQYYENNAHPLQYHASHTCYSSADNVQLLQYYNVQLLQYYNVQLLQYYNVQLLQYYNVQLLQYYNVQLLQYYNVQLLQYYDAV